VHITRLSFFRRVPPCSPTRGLWINRAVAAVPRFIRGPRVEATAGEIGGQTEPPGARAPAGGHRPASLASPRHAWVGPRVATRVRWTARGTAVAVLVHCSLPRWKQGQTAVSTMFLIIHCVLIAGVVAWIISESMSVVHTSKADLMECLDRGQDIVLNGCLMMLSGDIQEGEERDDTRRVNKTTNSNNPRKGMHCPPLVCIVMESR
jgi:hypothetical protein